MNINLTIKEVASLRRLGTALDSGSIPVRDVTDLVNALREKCSSGGAARSRGRKETRKDHYRRKLKAA